MATDDTPIFKTVKDISGGVNNRQQGSIISDGQVTVLTNVDIGVLGESKKRPGLTLVEDLGDDVGTGIFGFMPVGGTDLLIATHNQKLETYPGSSTFTERKTDFTAGTVTTMLKAGEEGEGDVLLVYVKGNNWFRFTEENLAGTGSPDDLGNTTGTSDSPPDSGVATLYRQRFWILKNNLLYWSTIFPTDFSTAFNTVANAYQVDVGTERALISIREQGIIVMGSDAIYGVNPGQETDSTPAATDKVEKLLDIGCVAGKTAAQVGDDVLFLAPDGVRALFRSQQDKLQSGKSFPLSYNLKTQYDDINWAQISKATAVYFDNKYFLSIPTGSSITNNQVWVYYPATEAWMIIDGWSVADFAKIIFSGKEVLYAIDSDDGTVYKAWDGYSDNSVAITYTEEGKKEDFEKPLFTKSGGEVRIKALASGDYDLDIYIELDDGGYQVLGTMNLSGGAPALPQSLPFNLGAVNIKEQVFHLDEYGPYRQIRLKIEQTTTNGSDDITIYERTIVTYGDEYQSESTIS